jgi:hypothetical protein
MKNPPTTEEILAAPSPLDRGPISELWDAFDGAHYDREGRQISFREWGKLHAVREYIRVAEDTIGPYWVSTVWIGLNYRFGIGPPLIFESMVFKGDESDLDCVRYSTLEQALEGHARMVEEVRLFAELGE